MNSCLLLIGPPGCGKSTFCATQLGHLNNPIIANSDDYIEEFARQWKMPYNETVEMADFASIFIDMGKRIAEAAKAGRDIVIDQTNYKRRDRQRFRDFVPRDYEWVGVVFEFDETEVRRRVVERAERTGKHIPEHVMDRMIGDYQLPLPGEFDRIIYVNRAVP